MFKHKLLAAAALVSLAVVSLAQAAVPTLQMQLSSGIANSGILTDTLHTGQLTYNASLGVFTILVATGTGVGSANPGGGNTIDLNSVQVTATSAAVKMRAGSTMARLPCSHLGSIGLSQGLLRGKKQAMIRTPVPVRLTC